MRNELSSRDSRETWSRYVAAGFERSENAERMNKLNATGSEAITKVILRAYLTLAILLVGVPTRRGTAAELPQALSVRGDSFRGRLTRIDEQWHCTFDAGEKRRVIAANELVHWGEFREREVGPLLVLTDGGILVADSHVSIFPDRVTFSSRRLWNETAIPRELVRGILYHPSPLPIERDRQLDKILSATGAIDQLLLANGDRVSGLARENEDSRSQGDEPHYLLIETGEQSITLPTDRIVSLVFNPAMIRLPQLDGTHALVGLRDGSRVNVQQVISTPDRLRLILAGGIVVETHPDFDTSTMWDEVVMLRPRSSRVTYLSDLDPISFKTVAFIENTLAFRRDRNARGGHLRSGGVLYAKGIGMHSTSRLAYRLGGEYRQFASELAIDELAGQRGSVQFRVYLADANGKWTRAYQSDIIRGGRPPVPVSVDVSEAIALALIVEFADYGDQLDYANWLNARLVR